MLKEDGAAEGKGIDGRPAGQITEAKHVQDGKVVLSGTLRNVPRTAPMRSFVKDSNGNYYPNDKPCEIGDNRGTWVCPELRLAAAGHAPDESNTVYVVLVDNAGDQEITQFQKNRAKGTVKAMASLPKGSTTIAHLRGLR
ncbi:hypothetical protein [Streptomyces sp. NPDC005732]|uniref:hypothetical protein n=1 Tax=Streptomyces sp. NPDC005732 TaxID=3157057 RepID=UPI0033EF36C1